MALQKTATKWILVWIALLLLAAPGQALSAVPQAKGKPFADAATETVAEDHAGFVLASRRGGVSDRKTLRRTHERKLRQPQRTSRRGKLSNPSTLRKWENSDKTRPTHERTDTMGSEIHRDSSRFERTPRSRDYEFYTPSSKESHWEKK